jgi:hypothetical protein
MHETPQSNLYDIYQKPILMTPPKPLMKPYMIIDDKSQYKEIIIRIPKQPTHICANLQKHQLFMEIEYLEKLYQHINIVIQQNHVITINASGPRQIPRDLPKSPMTSRYTKMPILSMCRGFIQQDKKIEIEYLPERMTFVVPPEYPVVPPYLYINNVLYLHLINCCHLGNIKQIVGKYTSQYREYKNCISCATIVSPNNWRAHIRFSDMIDEIREIRQIKRVVKYDLILEEIMIHKQLEYSTVVYILDFLIEL